MEMIVTKLEPYPKGKGRVSVYLNDRFAFVLYKGELSQYGIEEGIVMDDALYERILNGTLILRAKKRAMNLLMTTDRTESDVRRRLDDGGYPQEAVDAAIDYLKSFHYIDDRRYAGEYIRFKSSSMSRKQMTLKLMQKGIDKDIIGQAFSDQESEGGVSTQEGERELIRRLIAKRHPAGVALLDNAARQKLFAYLYNKGFAISEIESVYSEMSSGG